MKKSIAMAAFVGLAAAAFAQSAPDAPAAPTFTWSGYYSTGVSVVANGKDKAAVGLWDDDNFLPDGRFKLVGKYALGNAGFNFDLRASSTPVVTLKSAYAYGWLFNKLVYTQVGIINDQTTRPFGDFNQSLTKETPGFIVRLNPADGLSFNAALVNLNYGSTNANGVPIASTVDALDFSQVQTAFGGAYYVKGTGSVMAEALFQPTNAAKTNYALSKYSLGVNYTGVPNLNIWVEDFVLGWAYSVAAGVVTGKATTLNNGKNQGLTAIDEVISYSLNDMGMAPVTVGFTAYQLFYGKDSKLTGANDLMPSLKFNPWVSYALDGGITPKLGVSYFSGAEATGAGWVYNKDIIDNILNVYAPTPSGTDLNKVAFFEVKPSVKINIGPTQVLNLAYAYDVSVGADKAYFQAGKSTSTATSQHVFQANYIYSF